MVSPTDWRRRGQEEWLAGAVLFRLSYRPYSPSRNHEHCEFCWDTFSDSPKDLHEGYCTKPEDGSPARWICPACFADFREEFGWTVGNAPPADQPD